MEGRVTRFSSGIAGVAIVLFALMGTIGVGYLLNGTSGYENVNDYNYVTDVTGLYSYTPVPAYAEYSPATNNYQYSSDLSTLGTYTSGINYTPAAAANLNPIITPGSGLQPISGTITYASIAASEQNGSFVMGAKANSNPIGFQMKYKIQNLQTLIGDIDYRTLTVKLPNQDVSIASTNMSVQQIGIYTTTAGTLYPALNAAIDAKATAGGSNTNATTTANTSFTYNDTSPIDPGTYTMNNPVGIVSDITINPNGTATYTYNYGGVLTTVNKPVSEIYIISWGFSSSAVGPAPAGISYEGSTWTDSEYLDPNYGVSLSGAQAYWSNGNNLGSVSFVFQKPDTSPGGYTINPYGESGQLQHLVVRYSNGWDLQYQSPDDHWNDLPLGQMWDAIQITFYYSGEFTWAPVTSFVNFTNYRLGTSTTEAIKTTGGNEPITYCEIKQWEYVNMKFAVVGTTVESGTVPGAMFNATLNTGDYFPQYTDVRISFDSAAYVGTSVQVDTWTMSVDSASFYGQFIGLDNVTYFADLTQPWAITWNPGSNEVSITFTPRNEAGTITATILNADVARSVTLNGQWVIDTDLYSVGSHVEEVFKWDFGNWGLTKTQFIVCAMGLTALLSIAFRLAHVPFKGLDYVVIFFGNLILWVVL